MPIRNEFLILFSTAPVLNFSIAGLYSLSVKRRSLGFYPRALAISSISSKSNPNAGLGSLTPGAMFAFMLDKSMLAIRFP